MLSGTEADIINTVARLREATKDQIRKEVGFSTDYIGFLCQYLVRKGFLKFSNGRYSLSKAGVETLQESETDKRLIPVAWIKHKAGEEAREQINPASSKRCWIKIKTDFEFPVEDESSALESNIGKLGIRIEKEKSDIDRSVQLFREIQKEGRKK